MTLPVAFRILPDGAPIPLRRDQYRKIAACLHQHRVEGIFALAVISETGVEQWTGRLAEMRALGFVAPAFPQASPRAGDSRKLFRIGDNIELIWGEAAPATFRSGNNSGHTHASPSASTRGRSFPPYGTLGATPGVCSGGHGHG